MRDDVLTETFAINVALNITSIPAGGLFGGRAHTHQPKPSVDPGSDATDPSASVVTIDHGNGYVLAMVGGRDFFDGGPQ